jgi:hypothetical protein
MWQKRIASNVLENAECMFCECLQREAYFYNFMRSRDADRPRNGWNNRLTYINKICLETNPN